MAMIDLWFLYYGVMGNQNSGGIDIQGYSCLLYTSDAADD